MIEEIKKEIIIDIQNICKKFSIDQVINEEKRDEILGEQYENTEFPIIFYNIYSEKIQGIVDEIENQYRYDEEIEIILTLESRSKENTFNLLYLFLKTTKATNNYFKDRKYKRKIRNVYKLQDTEFNFRNRKYFKQVLQFSIFVEHTIKKEKWEEKWQ